MPHYEIKLSGTGLLVLTLCVMLTGYAIGFFFGYHDITRYWCN